MNSSRGAAKVTWKTLMNIIVMSHRENRKSKQDYKCTLYCLLNIYSFSGTHVAEKSSNEYFSDPLITTKTRNEKFARRKDPRSKKIRDRSLDPKKYQACKFSTQKNTSDPPVMYTSSTPPGVCNLYPVCILFLVCSLHFVLTRLHADHKFYTWTVCAASEGNSTFGLKQSKQLLA